MNLSDIFKKFEEHYKDVRQIDSKWYEENCGVFAKCKKANTIGKNGTRTEEWYRARMIWSLVELGYPPENICVEFSIPKGSDGAKSLNPDVIIFKNENWKPIYDAWDKESSVPNELRKLMLIIMEAKVDDSKVLSAVTKQLSEAMNSYIGEELYGVYFDNKEEPIVFVKELTHPIRRYYNNKIIDGEDLEKLNLNNRDDLSTLPNFSQFINRTKIMDDVSKLNLDTNQPITEENFADILKEINRLQDRLNVSHIQDLIVEFITLKVADEKEVSRGEKEFLEFYITPEEKDANGNGNQGFRDRIYNLYERGKTAYHTILTNPEFYYDKYKVNDKEMLRPHIGDDEKFLIKIIEKIQKKTILNDTNTNYNQIIFNNFGSNIDKAKEKQFFTPLHIVDAIVRMINPSSNEEICDPCAGICDFLAVSYKHIQKKHGFLGDANRLYGFDKDSKILKLALLNLVLNGDGNANIKTMDSIVNKLCLDSTITNTFSINNYEPYNWMHLNDNNKNMKKFDIIMTNPPFGRGRDLKTGKNNEWDVPRETIELYETWKISKEPLTIDMGIIFLENAYKLLRDGGRMAIVLSNSIAGIAQWAKVREWFISKMRIVGIFDLPQDTFGETGVATTVIIAYKPKSNERNILNTNYEVFIKSIKNIGYEVKTTDRIVVMKPIFEVNTATFERIKDKNGNDKRLTDLPQLVNEFNDWLEKNKHIYKYLYSAFNVNNYRRWEE